MCAGAALRYGDRLWLGVSRVNRWGRWPDWRDWRWRYQAHQARNLAVRRSLAHDAAAACAPGSS